MQNKTPVGADPFAVMMARIFDPRNLALLPATDGTDDETLEIAPTAPPEVRALRESQRTALSGLMEGQSYTEAAARARVQRKTLYIWVNKDPVFRAAMAAWRARMTQAAHDQLIQSTFAAARTLGTAASKDYRAAAILLKGRGLLEGKGTTEPDNPLAALKTLPPAKRRAIELRLRELIVSIRDESDAPAQSAKQIETTSANLAGEATNAARQLTDAMVLRS